MCFATGKIMLCRLKNNIGNIKRGFWVFFVGEIVAKFRRFFCERGAFLALKGCCDNFYLS